MSFFAEIWRFLRDRKKSWLVPLIIVMVLFALLVIVGESSALAPFIYTLF